MTPPSDGIYSSDGGAETRALKFPGHLGSVRLEKGSTACALLQSRHRDCDGFFHDPCPVAIENDGRGVIAVE